MSEPTVFLDGRVQLYAGDCLDVLKTLADNSIDSVCCDPPYHLTSIVNRFGGKNAAPCQEGTDGAFRRASAGFMGKQWDGGDIAFRVELWAEVLRVLKPGGHCVAFSGTRTYHRMAVAIEDAGFEIRDQIQWLYGSGFPKSHDVSKGIDKAAGAEREKIRHVARAATSGTMAGSSDSRPWIEKSREIGFHEVDGCEPITESAVAWQGWGTALKPANEPICLARKPLSEKTVAANVLRWGTGAINVDGCRIATDEDQRRPSSGGDNGLSGTSTFKIRERRIEDQIKATGRWPANLCHDGSDEVLAAFPESGPASSGRLGGADSGMWDDKRQAARGGHDDIGGSAARFFYSAKADSHDRIGSKHPTVKPVDLMQWLVRLVTPNGGVTIDPFAGTGTTGEAAYREGMRAVLIEREEEYRDDIARRMKLCLSGPDERSRESIKARLGDTPQDHGPLFAEPASQPASQPAMNISRRLVYGKFAADAPSDQLE